MAAAGALAGMRKVLAIIVLGIPPLLLIRWDSRHGNSVPHWLLLAICAPLVIALLVAELSAQDEVGDARQAIGNWLLFLMGLFGMGIGMAGFALRQESTLFGLFGWLFPVGAIMAIFALVSGLRD